MKEKLDPEGTPKAFFNPAWGCEATPGAISRRAAAVFELPASSRLAWCWLIGQGLVSLGAVLAVVSGAPLASALLLPLAVGVAGLASGRSPSPSHRLESQNPLLLAVTAFFALLALVVAWRSPALAWDGLAIWGLKARILAETGQLPLELLRHPVSLSMHPEYPLHLPLLGGVLGSLELLLGGDGSHRALPILTALNFSAIALLLAGALGRVPGLARTALLLGGLLTPLVWRELPAGLADTTLALCVLAMTLALGRWLVTGATVMAWLAAVAGGLGAFTKQEGAVWLLLGFTVAGVLAMPQKSAWTRLIAPGLLALALALPWHVFRAAIGLETERFAFDGARLERLPQVLGALAREWTDIASWGLLWSAAVPAAALTLLVPALRGASPARDPSRFFGSNCATAGPALLLLAAHAAIVLMFITTPHGLDWHLATALDRLLLQWWPVAMLVLAHLLAGARDVASSAP